MSEQPDLSGGESIRPYVALLKERLRWLIIGPIIVGLAVGSALYFTPRQYSVEASFVAQENESGGGGGGLGKGLSSIASTLGVSGVGGLPSLSGANNPDLYTALITAPQFLHDVVVTQYTSTQPGGFSGDLVKYFKYHKPTRIESELAAMKSLKRRLITVDIDHKSEIITVTVATKDPDLTAHIARRIMTLVNQFNLQRRQAQASAESDFTAQRSQDALANLQKSEDALIAFDERNRSVNTSPRLQTERSGLERRISIAEEVYLQLTEQNEQARLDAVRNTPVIAAISNPEGLVEPVQKYTVLKAVLATVLTLVAIAVFILVKNRNRLPGANLRESEPLPQSQRGLAAD